MKGSVSRAQPRLSLTGVTKSPSSSVLPPLPSSYLATGNLPWLHAAPGSPVGLLETPDGSYFPLRGVDVNGLIQYGPDWNESIPLTQADFAEMHALGFTFVRLSLSWSLLEPAPGVFNQSYLAALSQVVDWAGAEGIYVLVDMHQDLYNRFLAPNGTEQDGFPTWATFSGNASRTCPIYLNETTCLQDPAVDNAWNAFWNNTTVPGYVGLQEAYDLAWQELASTFANASNVAGYDLMNEPATGTVTSSLSPGFCPNGTWETEYQWEDCFLLPFYQSLIHSIRQVDSRHAIFFEPSVYTDALNWAPWNPVSLGDSNIVYEPHVYTNVFGPSANWSGNASALLSAYQNAQYNAQEFGGTPWFVGEFGTNPDHWHDGWIEANVNLANKFDVGSSFWEWKEGINVSTITEPGGNWGVVRENGTLRNSTARAEILASPHPVGAGGAARVESSVFNFSTSNYTLNITNGAPGGWIHLYLPSFWYPSGYVVNGTYTGLSYRNSTYVLPGGTMLDTSVLNVTCSCSGNYTVHVRPAVQSEGWLAGNVSPVFANVTVANRTVTLNRGNFTLALPPGSLTVTADAPGYVTQSMSAVVTPGNTTLIQLHLLPVPPPQYAITLSERGLPQGTSWQASVNGTGNTTNSSALTFREPNGTYVFTVGAVPGFLSSPSTGNVTVAGGPAGQSVTFTAIPPEAYAVTFTESGLPASATWSVTLNGSGSSSSTTTVKFQDVNGSYVFSVAAPRGYTANPSSGTLRVDGHAVSQSIAFASASPSKGKTGQSVGLTGLEGYLLVAVIVAAVAIAVAILLRRRPTKSSSSVPPPKEELGSKEPEGESPSEKEG